MLYLLDIKKQAIQFLKKYIISHAVTPVDARGIYLDDFEINDFNVCMRFRKKLTQYQLIKRVT